MSKTCVIMQPTYLPWMGYFALMEQADVFIIYDDVAFSKQSWQQRNKIKTSNGPLILTVPVDKNAEAGIIRDTRIANIGNWNKKHLSSILFSYAKAPYFKDFKDIITAIYSKEWTHLYALNTEIILFIKDYLDIKTELLIASEMNIQGTKVERLVKFCQAVGADTYLSPVGSHDYIDEENLFPDHHINLCYQHFNHPQYHQLYGDFTPYMAILDLLLNEGPASRKILLSGIGLPYTHEEISSFKLQKK